MKNDKTVDPRDKKSTKVIQLETAMGAAISCFEGAAWIDLARGQGLIHPFMQAISKKNWRHPAPGTSPFFEKVSTPLFDGHIVVPTHLTVDFT